MPKLAVIFTGLVSVDKNLVGTAVIYKKIAEIFRQEKYQVILVGPEVSDIQEEGIEAVVYEEKNNSRLIKSADVVVFGAYPPPAPLQEAYRQKKIIITYLWSIAPIGSLEFKDFKNSEEQAKLHRYISASYNLSLLLSDKIFCRDEGVKKLVLGSLISLGRVNLENYRTDRQLKNILEVAPFGIDKKANSGVNKKSPNQGKGHYRGIYPEIGKNDFILIWNGGIWNWNDGQTLIKAMATLKNEKIKLIFQGFKHPGKGKTLSKEAKSCLALAKKLKVADRTVFFTENWVPYQERASFLQESDAGIVTSPNIPEANLFFKTRIYDYLWAELPIILNDCEAFADLVQEKKLGLVVKTGDAVDLAEKITRLSRDVRLRQDIKKNIRKFKQEIAWENTLAPIRRFAKKPTVSRDQHDKKNPLVTGGLQTSAEILF